MSKDKFRFYDVDSGFMLKPYTLMELLEIAAAPRLAVEFENGGFMGAYELWQGLNVGNIKVLRYTGLSDKNGREIYEGDTLKIKHNSNSGHHCFYSKSAEVFWCDDDASFCVRARRNIRTRFTSMVARDSEVIGNIYENPELVGGKEDKA